MRITIVIAGPVLFGLILSDARGGLYEATMTGEVDYITECIEQPQLFEGVPMHLTYAFDSEARDLRPDDPGLGSYGITSWAVDVGPLHGECRGGCVGDTILIANDAGAGAYDAYLLTHLELPPSADYGDTSYFYLILGDTTTGAFVDDSLLTSLNLIDFNTTRFALTPTCGPTVRLGGEVQTLDIRLIPEPTTGLLAAAGTAAVLAWYHRRRAGNTPF